MTIHSLFTRTGNVKYVRFICKTGNHCSNKLPSYKHTVLIPVTTFPDRVSGQKRSEVEKEIREKTRFADLYQWQWKNNSGEIFTLHDGPPYANGKTHFGHAINKVLKDIINRYKVLQGFKVHYVPGWDCHGLPIELKAVKENKQNVGLSAQEIRKKAHQFASDTIKIQKASFKSWGIMADWNDVYKTYDTTYVTKELKAFYQLYKKGMVYRGFKPVYWSPSTRTALAESELEYNPNHKSTSAYVKFEVAKIPEVIKQIAGSEKVFALIWTTTPWSLPENQAIAYSMQEEYCILRSKFTHELYLVALKMVSQLCPILGTESDILGSFSGKYLEGAMYEALLFKQHCKLPFISGHHVTMDKGTGLVHTAPNLGFEDYKLIQQHKIPVDECLIDDAGLFKDMAGRELAGKNIFTDGNQSVLDTLKTNLVHQEDYIHSYPYDWRSKKPVIIRRSQQWFIDTDAMQERLQKYLENVKVLPSSAMDYLKKNVENRPHWCISRQRAWGVPIPVFYKGAQGEHVITGETVEHICKVITDNGPDCWWTLPVEKLFPVELRQQCRLPIDDNYTKGMDILDIWFDSGISWLVTLPEPKVADVYLEGRDQIRGWFQTSLLTSVALRDMAPYKCLYIHGFAVDKNGEKMSKSLGNVVDPEIIIEGGKNLKQSPSYGTDILRWWIALHASKYDNVPVADHILKESAQNVLKIRNVMRFLLGSLNDFNERERVSSLSEMELLDRYILHRLYHISHKVMKSYEDLRFASIGFSMLEFIVQDVSALHCKLIKDRLYCDNKNSPRRKSCLTTLSLTLEVLIQFLAPILPHFAEEIYMHHPQLEKRKLGAFRKGWFICPPEWNQPEVAATVYILKQIQSVIFKSAENTVEYDITILAPPCIFHHLKKLQNESKSSDSPLCEFFQVSTVMLSEISDQNDPMDGGAMYPINMNTSNGKEEENIFMAITPASLQKCGRCRRYCSESTDTLCARCQHVLDDLNITTSVSLKA